MHSKRAGAKWCKILLSLTLICPSLSSAEEVYDPLEPINRGIFWFNDKFDVYLLEPVARGYDKVMPDTVQDSVGNFFENIRYPSYLVSDIIQLKFNQVGQHTARFLINTTLGLAGLFDVATEMGVKEHDEDFGVALAYHGVPAGPYLVIPFIGPSNLRDGIGLIADGFLSPVYYVGETDVDSSTEWVIVAGTKALQVVDTRANLFDAIETAKESSLDYYLFMQSAYYQYRRGVIYDGHPPDEFEDEDFEADGDAEEVEVTTPPRSPNLAD